MNTAFNMDEHEFEIRCEGFNDACNKLKNSDVRNAPLTKPDYYAADYYHGALVFIMLEIIQRFGVERMNQIAVMAIDTSDMLNSEFLATNKGLN